MQPNLPLPVKEQRPDGKVGCKKPKDSYRRFQHRQSFSVVSSFYTDEYSRSRGGRQISFRVAEFPPGSSGKQRETFRCANGILFPVWSILRAEQQAAHFLRITERHERPCRHCTDTLYVYRHYTGRGIGLHSDNNEAVAASRCRVATSLLPSASFVILNVITAAVESMRVYHPPPSSPSLALASRPCTADVAPRRAPAISPVPSSIHRAPSSRHPRFISLPAAGGGRQGSRKGSAKMRWKTHRADLVRSCIASNRELTFSALAMRVNETRRN